MSKYYTPEIEEFYVGFEFESKRGAYDGTVKTQEQFDNEKWQYDFCSEGDLPYIERALTGTNAKNGLCHLRVKYLDREDIESLGFSFKYSEKSSSNIAFTKPYENHPRYDDQYVDIVWNSKSRWIVIASGDDETGYSDWNTHFVGNIKNKSELKKLLKQLGI